MKLRKLSAATAILASGALVLSGCTPGGDDEGTTPDNGAAEGTENGNGGTYTAEETGEFTQEGAVYSQEPTDGALYDLPEDFETADDTIIVTPGGVPFQNVNNDEAGANSVNNSVVASMLSSGFMYFGTDLSINFNEEFGSVEMTQEADEDSGEPMIVEYTINDEVVWSDGTPVTALDYKLYWASQAYAGPAEAGEDYDEEESGPFEPGAGFNPSSSSVPLQIPEVFQAESPDSKTFTAEFPSFYADWQLLVSGPGVPAHIVAEQAGMSTDELNTAIEEGDTDALQEVAEIWNQGLGYAGEWDEELTLSSGPYQIAEWNWQGEEAGGSVTLEPNPNWWGSTPPGVSTLIFQFVDESTHVQALENGDIHVAMPQPDEDVATELRRLEEDGVLRVYEGDIATWEHIDFQRAHGIFAEYPEAMEAFALCLPREQIVEQIIRPVNPQAEVLNAREMLSFMDGYDEYVDGLDIPYQEADIDAAAEILEEIGAVGETLEIHHFGQPRRHAAVEIIDSYCGAEGAGFNIVDAGDANFGGEVLGGEWGGIAMYAWSGSGQIVSGRNIYASDGAQNPLGYSNPEVDSLWDEIGSDVSDEERTDLLMEMEQILWDDLYSIPVYVHPGLDAADDSIGNVRPTAAQTQISWNAEQWQRFE